MRVVLDLRDDCWLAFRILTDVAQHEFHLEFHGGPFYLKEGGGIVVNSRMSA